MPVDSRSDPAEVRAAELICALCRVRRLVLVGPPALPGTRCPLPYRLLGTPGVGQLLPRLMPPSPKSLLRLAKFMGEKSTLPAHPDLVDMFVAAGRDRSPTGARKQRCTCWSRRSPC